MSTKYGLSWIYEEFQLVRLHHGKCVESWSAPGPVHNLAEFASALRSGREALKIRGGQDIAIAYESDDHSHVFLDLPPMSTKDREKYLGRRVKQEKKFDDDAAWGYRLIKHDNGSGGALLHILPERILGTIMHVCENNSLVPRRLVPLTDIMVQHFEQEKLLEQQVSLIIALFESRVEMVVVRDSEEVLLVRELGFHWKFDGMDRLRLDMERTLRYAKQRHACLISQIFLMGEGAAEAAENLQSNFDVPVKSYLHADSALFWATHVSFLPRRTTSNLIPPMMQNTITSRQWRKAGFVMAATSSLVAAVVVAQVEFLIAKYDNLHAQFLQLSAELLEEKHRWEEKYRQLDDSQNRIDQLTLDKPPVPAWFLAGLGDMVPENLILTRAQIRNQDSSWGFLLEGSTKPTLADTAQLVEQLEDSLRQDPWNAFVSRSWQSKWLANWCRGRRENPA